MSTLIDTTDLIKDTWERLDDDVAIGGQTKVIVSPERLKRDWEELSQLDVEIGVELEPDAIVEDILYALPKLKLVGLQFEVFADGRAFSQAKLLRDRYEFAGDIRAMGDVIRDQLAFMHRCGFSQFEIPDDEDSQLALLAFSEISYGYQSDLNHLSC